MYAITSPGYSTV